MFYLKSSTKVLPASNVLDFSDVENKSKESSLQLLMPNIRYEIQIEVNSELHAVLNYTT